MARISLQNGRDLSIEWPGSLYRMTGISLQNDQDFFTEWPGSLYRTTRISYGMTGISLQNGQDSLQNGQDLFTEWPGSLYRMTGISLQNDRDLFTEWPASLTVTCFCGNTGVGRIPFLARSYFDVWTYQIIPHQPPSFKKVNLALPAFRVQELCESQVPHSSGAMWKSSSSQFWSYVKVKFLRVQELCESQVPHSSGAMWK